MLKNCLYIAVLLMTFFGTGTAQDIHFTLFDMTPIVVNPSQTGNYEGSFRVGGIYRDQAASVTGFGSQYSTPHFYIDANFDWGFRPQDWVSVGINFLSDKSGDIGLGRTGYQASAAYHLALDKNYRNIISIGAQYGNVTVGVSDPSKAVIL